MALAIKKMGEPRWFFANYRSYAQLLATLSISDAYEYWQKGLQFSKEFNRENGPQAYVVNMLPYIEALGGEVALRQTLLAMDDAQIWWP